MNENVHPVYQQLTHNNKWRLMIWDDQEKRWTRGESQEEKFPGILTVDEGWTFQCLDEKTNEWHCDPQAVVHLFSEEPVIPAC